MKKSFTLQGKVAIIVTVHRFRGSGFTSNPPAIVLPSFQSYTADRYGGQALTVDSCVMKAERMKTERLEDIES